MTLNCTQKLVKTEYLCQ